MVYLYAFISSLMMLSLIGVTVVLLLWGRGLGHANIYLAIVGFVSLWFLPLFYGSVGSLLVWPEASLILSKAWLAFLFGPILLIVGFILLDRFLKSS